MTQNNSNKYYMSYLLGLKNLKSYGIDLEEKFGKTPEGYMKFIDSAEDMLLCEKIIRENLVDTLNLYECILERLGYQEFSEGIKEEQNREKQDPGKHLKLSLTLLYHQSKGTFLRKEIIDWYEKELSENNSVLQRYKCLVTSKVKNLNHEESVMIHDIGSIIRTSINLRSPSPIYCVDLAECIYTSLNICSVLLYSPHYSNKKYAVALFINRWLDNKVHLFLQVDISEAVLKTFSRYDFKGYL